MAVRILSYRNKRRAKLFLAVLAAVLAVILLFCLCRFIYLQRFLVYSSGSVQLDYDQNLISDPTAQQSPWDPGTVQIVTEEASVQASSTGDAPMKQLSGYYITTDMLQDMDKVTAALAEAGEVKTVMLDLKSDFGNFYYSSGIYGAVTTTYADVAAVDALIEDLAGRDNVYLIARVASLTDNNFALENQSCGLPLASGALWMSGGCYWLDPMATSVQEYLVSIAQELAAMGFDEIVFDEFWIPDSTNIVYNSELTREEAAAEAAKTIRSLLTTDPIRVSFNSSNPKVAEVSDRVYLVTEDGSAVAGLVEEVQEPLEDPAAQIVFLTASRDTRFNGYGLLRPLIEARSE